LCELEAMAMCQPDIVLSRFLLIVVGDAGIHIGGSMPSWQQEAKRLELTGERSTEGHAGQGGDAPRSA
jgi:hypothetical protein